MTKKMKVSGVCRSQGNAHSNVDIVTSHFSNGAKHSSWLLSCWFSAIIEKNTFGPSLRKYMMQLPVLRRQNIFWPWFQKSVPPPVRANLYYLLKIADDFHGILIVDFPWLLGDFSEVAGQKIRKFWFSINFWDMFQESFKMCFGSSGMRLQVFRVCLHS